MPNIAAMLKAEIERLARKETKRQMAPVRKASTTHRRQLATLKREVARLERRVGSYTKGGRRAEVEAPNASPSGPALRFQARGLRALRSRLGLSAGALAKLLGVSQQSVYNWELGHAKPRQSQVVAIAQLRRIGKKEANARLKSAGAAAKPGRKKGQ